MNNQIITSTFKFFKERSSFKDAILCSFEYDNVLFVPMNKSINIDQNLIAQIDFQSHDFDLIQSFLIQEDGKQVGIISLHFLEDLFHISGINFLANKKTALFLEELSFQTGVHLYKVENLNSADHAYSLLDTKFFIDQGTDDTLNLSLKGKFQTGKDLILTAGPSISCREAFYSYDAALRGWNNEW